MENQDSKKKAFDYAIRLLSRRDYSIYKLRNKLSSRKFGDDDIDYTIEKLKEYNYLRENEYKSMRIKQLLVKGFSNSYIIYKIATEKIQVNNLEINAIREEQHLSTISQVDNMIEKKLRHKEKPEHFEEKILLKKKLMSFLVSKGHSFEVAQERIYHILQI